MDNQKPKEPLMALMLTFLFVGIGQLYVGQVKKGIAFLLINIVGTVGMASYLLNPTAKIYSYMLIIIPLSILFGLYIFIDAYQGAKKFNQSNNLTRNISLGKRILLIVGILFFYLYGPQAIFAKYMRVNVIQTFRLPSDSLTPVLTKGDRIVVNKAAYKNTAPERGDIIVFEYPGSKKRTSIKRVVALSGETVEMKPDGVYVEGNRLKYPELEGIDFYNRKAYDGREALHKFKIEEGYFYLLDKNMGAIMPLSQFRGKAFKIYYPFDRSGAIK